MVLSSGKETYRDDLFSREKCNLSELVGRDVSLFRFLFLPQSY